MSTRRKTPQNGSDATVREPVVIDGATGLPTPSPRRPKHARLNDLRDVRRELAKIYRATKAGEIAPDVGTKLTYMLSVLSRVTAESEHEARLRALEELVDDEAI